MFVEDWEPGELKVFIESENKEIEKEGALSMKPNATPVLKSASQQQAIIVVRHEWSAVFAGEELGKYMIALLQRFVKITATKEGGL